MRLDVDGSECELPPRPAVRGSVALGSQGAGACPVTPGLSKSKVLAGQQCSRRLWFTCFTPELAGPPDARLNAILEAGTEVGRKAHGLFPGGVLVEEQDSRQALTRTRALVADPTVPAIFEAAFEHDRVRIRVDVLERLADGAWGLREVKSSGGVKDVHIYDVAVQQYVLEGVGLKVSSLELIHVDTQYVRGAGPIDWRLFFKRADVAAAVRERRVQVPAIVADLHQTLALTEAPVVEPSPHCWTPYGCEFWEHCTRDKPEDWILHLPHVRTARMEALRAAGVERITEIPDDFDLGAIPARIRDVLQSGREFVSPQLGSALEGFGPPAFYLDFETMNPAIPLYPGTRPYERLPFQWSLHRVDRDGGVIHREFLADGRSDPRRMVAEGLVAALGGNTDPIVVYSSFESSVLNDLAAALPDLAPEIQAVRRRLRDLLRVVQAHVYRSAFRCSFSLKSVAPALVPGFGYDDLEAIANGAQASTAIAWIAAGRCMPDEELRIRHDLLAYCARDTLALVELHRVLRHSV